MQCIVDLTGNLIRRHRAERCSSADCLHGSFTVGMNSAWSDAGDLCKVDEVVWFVRNLGYEDVPTYVVRAVDSDPQVIKVLCNRCCNHSVRLPVRRVRMPVRLPISVAMIRSASSRFSRSAVSRYFARVGG